MTPRLIWHGGFIDASKHWVDRGPGNQTPLGDHIMTLPAGPPLATLVSLDEPWPDKSPRENGFHFRGYTLDAAGVPAFKYQWNDVSVTDSLQPFMASPDNGLQRTVMVKSSARLENVYLRIAAGPKIEAVDGVFVTNGIQLKFDEYEPVIRTIGGHQELLVPVQLNADGRAIIRYSIVW